MASQGAARTASHERIVNGGCAEVGQEVTLILNENNNVIDMHLKGRRCAQYRDRKVGVCGQDEAGD